MSKRVDEYTEIAVDPGASALGARTTGETVRYPIGTAASADVTTSATDTTAGRVMRVDDYPSDTAWTTSTTLLNGWTGTVQYIKRAGMVTVNIERINGSAKINDAFFNMPAGYQVGISNLRIAAVNGFATPTAVSITLTGGTLQCGTSDTDVRATFTYPVIT